MAQDSKIEWTHHTFNPWRGCTKVSDGCKHCYAETLSARNPRALGQWGPNGARAIAAESYWREPLKWDRAAAAAGERHRVFCASLADVFEGPDTMPAEAVAPVEAARARLFDLIYETKNLDWLLLTKRPENVLPMIGTVLPILTDIWPNLWIGTSVEDQAAADKRIPLLLDIPAAVRFLSMEPLLGPVDLGDDFWETSRRVEWVIVGGESGPGARPMHPAWARSIRDQCQAAGVPFLFKQWGEFAITTEPTDAFNSKTRDFETVPAGGGMTRVGKKAADRLLDGREWSEFPVVATA